MKRNSTIGLGLLFATALIFLFTCESFAQTTCNANFQYVANTHNPDSIHFYPASPSSVTAIYSWSFGDGAMATGQDPWHFYTHAGSYWACLTVTLSTGQTCTHCDSVHVVTPPPPTCSANFQFTPNTHNPDSVHFYPSTNISTGAYSWSFGDGTSSTNHDPWHLYANAGTYWVCLTVTLSTGQTCTHCDSVHVVAPPPPTCNANFLSYPNTHNPDSIHFYPSSNVTTASYSWSFGDGSTSTNHDAWHLYANAGTYWVCLTVTLSTGQTCSHCDSVHVVAPPPPTCSANFQFTPNTHNPDSVHFYPSTNISTGAYSWSFGDGTSSTNHDPWHLYANAGTYLVCLTVTLSTGQTCSHCDSVHVVAPPPPVCNANFQFYSNTHNPDSIHFYPSTNVTTASYSWSFGDGSTSTNHDAWHLYANAGSYWVCLTVTLSTGQTCSHYDSVHVVAPPPPTCSANFQFTPNTHNPDSVHFYPSTNISTGAYSWSFGDGTSSTNHDPWHLYANAGTYWVCLTVTLSTGQTCSHCDSVHVVAPPPPVCNANFQFYSNTHNPDSIHFYPSTNVTTASYSWSFGDGSTSTNHDAWHLYANAGSYWVCLTVTLSTGQTCTHCDSVHVVAPPPPTCNANFQFYSNTHNPDSVHFYPSTNISTGAYSWSFGDGTSSTNHDPWHLYANAGTYWVCLTVTLSTGQTCTHCDSVHVVAPPPPTCNANFQFYSNPHNPDSIHFYPVNPTSSIATYNWTFGDGTSSTNHDPWHLYSHTGSYWVCLTVTLSTGQTCSHCDSIHVVAPPPPVCNANFQFYRIPQNPDSIHFYPASPVNATATYAWSFGDGTSSTNHDPWHVFTQPGAYWVCLTVTLSTGQSCTHCDSVHVYLPPPVNCDAHFFFAPNQHNPDSIHFHPGIAAYLTANYLWSFGDGSSSTNRDPWHLYANPGSYWACLTITLTNGQSCTHCDSIHVFAPPPPVCNSNFQFYANQHSPDSIHFYPVSPTSTIATYSWTFGDGTSSTNHDPWHLYANAGSYWVCLTVTLSNGQTCSHCDSVHVVNQPPCTAHFNHNASLNNPDSIHYYPQTPGAISYFWTFGDGGTSTHTDPWHLYSASGMYNTCLTAVFTSGSCTWCDSVQGMVVNPGNTNNHNEERLVFPNPVTTTATIDMQKHDSPGVLDIFDVAGLSVFKANVPANSMYTLDTSPMKNGVYHYTIISNGQLITQGQMVIMH